MSEKQVTNEHPSLIRETVGFKGETLETARNELDRLRETVADMQSRAARIASELESVGAVELINDLQRQLSDFTTKYGAIIDKMASMADAEIMFLQKLSEKIDEI